MHLFLTIYTPWSEKGALGGGGAEDHGGVIGNVEEDEIEGHEVYHHSQEDHRGASESIVLAHQAEQASAWQARGKNTQSPSP